MPLHRYRLRRATSSQWASDDPVLAAGEPGLDTTTRTMKVGDGSSTWSELEGWSVDGGGSVGSVNGAQGTVVLDAADIGVTPAGSLSSTDVQAALVELGEDLDLSDLDPGTTTTTEAETVPTFQGGVLKLLTLERQNALRLKKSDNLSDLASKATARSNLGLGVVDDDLTPKAIVNTASETSLFNSPLTIPASSLAVGDVLECIVAVSLFNNSGSTRTFDFRGTIGSDVLYTSAAGTPVSLATGTFLQFMDIRFTIMVAALSPSPRLVVTGRITPGQANSYNVGTTQLIGSVSTAPTSAPILLDFFVTMSAASNVVTTGMQGATLTRRSRAF